jgi:ATP-binding cassette, subfamily B, multidrug efflux pump
MLLDGPEKGGLTKGDFFAFWSAMGSMSWPMIALGFSLAIIQRGRAGYARLREIFDASPEVVDGPLASPASDRRDAHA